MAQLLADGYLSNASRTEAEMQTAFETIRDILAELGSAAPVTLTIDGGGEIVAPTSRFVLVRSAGHATGTPDILDSISVTSIDDGRFVLLRNVDTTTTSSTGDYVTVQHGTASATKEIHLADDSDFVLSGERMLMLCRVGNFWEEVWRSYGRKNSEDVAAERTWLGLGTASVENVATAVASTAGKVLKVSSSNLTTGQALLVDSSGKIVGGVADGGDADTLNNLADTDFVRSTGGAAQTITGSLTVQGTTVTTDSTSGTGLPGVSLTKSGVQRGSMYLNNASGDVFLRSKNSAGAFTTSLQLDSSAGKLKIIPDAVTAAQNILDARDTGPGGGLNADMLDGVHLDGIITDYTEDTSPGTSNFTTAGNWHFLLPSMNLMVLGGEINHAAGSSPSAIVQFTILHPSAPIWSKMYTLAITGCGIQNNARSSQSSAAYEMRMTSFKVYAGHGGTAQERIRYICIGRYNTT